MRRYLSSGQHRKSTIGSLFVLLGVLLMLLGLASSCQHYYISAAQDSQTEYWMQHDWIDGEPVAGQPGCLFEGMLLTVESNGKLIFSGPMSSLDIVEVTDVFSAFGEETEIQLTFYLPGDGRNSNDYQGAWLKTRLRFLVRCTDSSGNLRDCPISIDSPSKLLTVYGMMPGDSYSATMRVTVDSSEQGSSRVPLIGEIYPSFWLFLLALLLVISGLLFKSTWGKKQEDGESLKLNS